jgi:hypothetical protein
MYRICIWYVSYTYFVYTYAMRTRVLVSCCKVYVWYQRKFVKGVKYGICSATHDMYPSFVLR